MTALVSSNNGDAAMLQTYRATLKGDRLEWMGATPGDTAEGVEVYVTIIQEDGIGAETSNGQKMAEACVTSLRRGRSPRYPIPWHGSVITERIARCQAGMDNADRQQHKHLRRFTRFHREPESLTADRKLS